MEKKHFGYNEGQNKLWENNKAHEQQTSVFGAHADRKRWEDNIYQGMDRPGVRQVPEGSGEQGKMEKTGFKIICGDPTTLVVKGLMMMTLLHIEKQTRNGPVLLIA